MKEYKAKLFRKGGFWFITSDLGTIELDTDTSESLDKVVKFSKPPHKMSYEEIEEMI